MKILVLSFLLLSFLIAYCCCGKPHQIHLSLGADPSQMYVTWATKQAVVNPVVKYRKSLNGSEQKAAAKTTHFTDHGKSIGLYIHRALMTNLSPGTKYHYQCVCNKFVGTAYDFTTIDNKENFLPKLAVFGDMEYPNSKVLTKTSIPQLTKDVKQGLYSAIFHIGDISYHLFKDKGQKGINFMNAIEPIAARTPYQVCPGNHESERNFSHYRHLFTMVGHDKTNRHNQYHSVKIGPMHIILFSTEIYYKDQDGKRDYWKDQHRQWQYNWLEKDLKHATNEKAKRPWIIVMGHRAMYHAGDSIFRNGNEGSSKHSQQFYKLEQLFQKYRVDVAFWGHYHHYSRTFPVFDKKFNATKTSVLRDPEMPIHIISGNGGPPKRGSTTSVPKFVAAVSSDFGFTRVKMVNKYQMELEQYSIEKHKVVDKITIIKSNNRNNSSQRTSCS